MFFKLENKKCNYWPTYRTISHNVSLFSFFCFPGQKYDEFDLPIVLNFWPKNTAIQK